MPRSPSLRSSAIASGEHAETVRGSFGRYVDQLAGLLAAPSSLARSQSLAAALDGEISRRLRDGVPLGRRRSEGAFFTGRALADHLLANDTERIVEAPVIADAACGAGDLLLAAARLLPIGKSVTKTLDAWGQRLIGRDLNPLYVRAARLRLALLASARTGRAWQGGEAELEGLLPHVTEGDGTTLGLDQPGAFAVLNPPFGSTVQIHATGSTPVA